MFHVTVQTSEMAGDVFGQKLDFLLRMCTRTTATDWLIGCAPTSAQLPRCQNVNQETFGETRSLFLSDQEFHDTGVVTFFFFHSVEVNKKKHQETNLQEKHLRHVPS